MFRWLYRWLPWLAVAAVAVAVTLLIGWRFIAASLSVDFLSPSLRSALAEAVPGLDVHFDRLAVRWGGWRHGIDIVARDTHVAAGDFAAEVPEIVLRLSLRALLLGRVLPSQIEIVGIAGRVVREADGRVQLVAVGDRAERPVAAGALDRLFTDLGSPPTPRRPLTYMRYLRLRDARITLEDQGLDVTWDADGIDVELFAGLGVVGGVYRSTLRLDAHPAHIEGSVEFDPESRLLHVDAAFMDIPFDSIATRAPRLANLFRLRAAMSGELGIAVSLAGAIREFSFDVSSSPGEIAVASWLPEPQPLAGLRLAGRFSEGSRWQIDPLRLEFGTPETPTPQLEVTAAATIDASEIGIEAEVTVEDLRVADFARFWPEQLESGTRKWIVENITTGAVPEARVRGALRLPRTLDAPPQLEQVDGSLRFDDLSVRWGAATPPVTGLDGSGTISRTALHFQVERGAVDELRLTPTTVDLLNLGTPPTRLRIEAAGRGPVSTALHAISLRPPEFIRVATADADTSRVEFRAKIGFALDGKVEFEDLDLDVEATVDDVGVHSVIGVGTAGGPLLFRGKDGTRQLSGVVDVVDLHSEVPILGWTKAVGEPGEVQFELALGPKGAERLDRFQVTTDTARATGTAEFDPASGALTLLDFDSLEVGRTRPQRARLAWSDGDLDVEIYGGSVDLVPVMQTPDALGRAARRALRVAATGVEALHLNATGWLEGISGRVEQTAEGWQVIDVTGSLPAEFTRTGTAERAAIAVQVAPSAFGRLTATLDTSDFGGLAAVLGWTRSIEGGSLRVRSDDLGPALNSGAFQIDAKAFHVRDTPIIVRLLSLASLDSLVARMQGEALAFEALTGGIVLDGDTVQLKGLRAHGSSLGWTARGSLARSAGTIDIDGILVPAYGANRLLAAVPLLRQVLVGEGLFATDFHIGGTLREPEVDVHAMSALTPALLRGIFGYPQPD